MKFGVMSDDEYNATHLRDRITVWSGPFYEVYEAEGYSLPNDDGYMLTTYNGDKVRVSTFPPRDTDTYEAIDAAINDALNAHYSERGK